MLEREPRRVYGTNLPEYARLKQQESMPVTMEITPDVREEWRKRNKNQDMTDEQIQFVTSGSVAPADVETMLGIFRSLRQRDTHEIRMELQAKVQNGSKPAQEKLDLLAKWEGRAHAAQDARDEEEYRIKQVRKKMDLGNHNKYGYTPDWQN